jgi:hypothetical protein
VVVGIERHIARVGDGLAIDRDFDVLVEVGLHANRTHQPLLGIGVA